MRIRRRSLRKLLIAVGCVVATIEFPEAMVGGIFLLAGSGLHFWSKGCLEQNRRLTTAGPYRWTRNPFYLANLLIDLGLCFVIGWIWVALLYMPIWFVAYRATIAREEPRLLELFPEKFPIYRDAVPALIPTGRSFSAEYAEGHFSLANDALANGSEYARLIGIWLAPALIWACEVIRRERLALFEEENSMALALIVFLPAAWIAKLALAETLRRPETTLLPFRSRLFLRSGVALGLFGIALFIEAPWVVGSLWAMSLPATWCVLMLLDRLGEARLAGRQVDEGVDEMVERALWRAFPAIATGGVLTFVSVAVLVQRAGG